jgi:hypothetical protein
MVLTSYLGSLNILQIKFSFLYGKCCNGFETSLEINGENEQKNNKPEHLNLP